MDIDSGWLGEIDRNPGRDVMENDRPINGNPPKVKKCLHCNLAPPYYDPEANYCPRCGAPVKRLSRSRCDA